ncbi:methyltransferase domain-containing protein [Colletotrichum tofieldiae]|nr:methyltransferase domain-containing protein [Colletotrichum tofieldiae]
MADAQNQHQDHLIADDESLHSDTTSVRNSILEYRMENGRSYHKYKDGSWDSLRTVTKVLRSVASSTSVPEPGCGPSTTLITIPKLRFEVDDVEEEWLYSQPFDYIHLRFMNGSLADWKKIITKAYDNLLPGGYLEIQDNDCVLTADDGTLPSHKPLAEFGRLIREAAKKFGRAFIPCPELKDLLVDVGFEDVALQNFKWPSNPWPKDPHHKRIGEWNFHNFVEAAEALALAPLTRGHNWTNEEVQVFLVGVRKDMRDMRVHSYMPM